MRSKDDAFCADLRLLLWLVQQFRQPSPGQCLLFKARCLSFIFYPQSDTLGSMTSPGAGVGQSWKLCVTPTAHVYCALHNRGPMGRTGTRTRGLALAAMRPESCQGRGFPLALTALGPGEQGLELGVLLAWPGLGPVCCYCRPPQALMPMQAGFLWPSPRGSHGDCTGTAWERRGDGMGTARAVTRPGLDVPGQGIWQLAMSNSVRVSCWWLHQTLSLCSVPTPGFGFIDPERNTAAMAIQLPSWGFPVVAGDKSPRCRVSAQFCPLLSRGPLLCGA